MAARCRSFRQVDYPEQLEVMARKPAEGLRIDTDATQGRE